MKWNSKYEKGTNQQNKQCKNEESNFTPSSLIMSQLNSKIIHLASTLLPTLRYLGATNWK